MTEWSVADTLTEEMASLREKNSEDHFYGAWRGGSKASGGGPEKSLGKAPDDRVSGLVNERIPRRDPFGDYDYKTYKTTVNPLKADIGKPSKGEWYDAPGGYADKGDFVRTNTGRHGTVIDVPQSGLGYTPPMLVEFHTKDWRTDEGGTVDEFKRADLTPVVWHYNGGGEVRGEVRGERSA